MKSTDIASTIREIRYFLEKYKAKLYLIQLVISFYAIAISIWQIVTIVKKAAFKEINFNINPWVNIFFRSIESNVLNYVFLCVVMFILSTVIYVVMDAKRVEQAVNKVTTKIETANATLQIFLLTISIVIVIPSKTIMQENNIFATVAVVLFPLIILLSSLKPDLKALPWLSIFCRKRDKSEINYNRIVRISSLILLLCLLVAVSLEPINVMRGPVYLFNEYDISSETLLNGDRIDNETFLKRLPTSIDMGDVTKECPAVSLGILKECTTPGIIFSNDLPRLNLSHNTVGRYSSDRYNIRDFILVNALQFDHFNISRGQMNHIGTVLNPLGAIELGKSLDSSYLQYGIGNTLIFKWIMDLFGGVSIQNYYKCYILYIVYAILFLTMLFCIFRNPFYVLAGFGVFAFTFFYQGYVPFIIAPGTIPSIHLLDAVAVILFVAYVRTEKVGYLLLTQCAALLAVMINRQFGMALLLSLMVAVVLYHIETRQKNIWVWCMSFFAAISSVFSFNILSSGRTDYTLKYFFLGYFSWPTEILYIQIGLFFITLSYLFLFMLKDTKHHMKYVYVMVFIYLQGLCLYFYWSGRQNHLPMILPFFGLQIIIMLFMLHHGVVKVKRNIYRCMIFVTGIIPILLLLYTVNAGKMFYKQKASFLSNFVAHTNYSWNFDRAKVITTINNKPIDESLNLIKKYSAGSKGIYLISRYDNLLPFLSNHYSQMPYFEMSWHMISQKDVYDTISFLKKAKPVILYADTDIMENKKDVWEKLFHAPVQCAERESRMGRTAEMRKIFLEIRDSYQKVEEGQLISVYKLK